MNHNYNTIKSKPYLVNAGILLVFTIAFYILFPKAHYELQIFMICVISYLCIANIIGIYLRLYGIRYTKHKPKVYVFDGKTYFRLSLPNKTIFSQYYGYRCWDFADIVIHNVLINPNDGKFNRYYRTSDGPFEKVAMTRNRYKAFFANLLTIICCILTICIYKE